MTQSSEPRAAQDSPRVARVKRALIDAVLKLMEERSLAAVSVREIADVAGVNNGLVHRYFGSKENLARAAVAHASSEFHATDPTPASLVGLTQERIEERPDLIVALARTCLDGPHDLLALASPSPEALERSVEPLRRLLSSTPLGADVDPYLLNALGVAAQLGWCVFRPWLSSGFGIPDDADEQLRTLIQRLDALLALETR